MTRSTSRMTTWLPAMLTAALLLGGCGSGSGGVATPTAPAPLTAAALSGQVVEIDGATTALGGIAITLAETGQTALTATDGTFDFGAVPTGSLSLSVAAPSDGTYVVLASGSGTRGDGMDGDAGQGRGEDNGEDQGDDDSEHGRPTAEDVEDGEDLDDDDNMHVHRAEHREQIRVRLRICDGEVCEMQVSRSGHTEREVEVRMTRTEANEDADMEGKVELESRDDRERLKVCVSQADPDLLLEAVVVDLDGAAESLGTRTVGAGGEARWVLDTFAGGVLPHGAAGVEDLEGYDVEVRNFDTETALLVATLPELPAAVEDVEGESPDDGNGPDEGERTRMRARARLEAHERDVEGSVELESRPADGEECFEIEAEHLASGREVVFELETGERTGQFTRLRQMTANAAGEAELEINTRHGDTLPNDAEGVRDLVRLRTQVRDADTDEVILSGTVPALVIDE